MTKNAEFVKNHWYWRPGWQIGSRFYTWHITFADQGEVTALADGYRSHLKNVPAVDIVPTQWLHLTMQGIGFVEGVFFLREIAEKALARGNARVVASGVAADDPHPSLGAVTSEDAEPPR